MVKMARTGLLHALALSALCGCVAAVVGSGGGNQGVQAPRTAAAIQADAAVTAEVKSRLAADGGLAAGSIGVDTRDGVVTLRGRVASNAQRTAAERDAWAARGVKAVISNLEVR
jgi:osmotically-inducible protein OsmY